MDKLKARLLRFNPSNYSSTPDNYEAYEKDITSHIRNLQTDDFTSHLQPLEHARQLLDSLDPALHTASFGVLLDIVIAKHGKHTIGLLDDDVLRFSALCDPIQIRYILPSFNHIVGDILNLERYSPSVAVRAASIALRRLDPTGTYLSSLHIRLVSIAYQTSTTDAILSFIQKTPIFFPGTTPERPTYLCSRLLSPAEYIHESPELGPSLQATDIMEYDLTCGLIFCRHRQWSLAQSAFARGATYPLKSKVKTSKIGLEAYKRWIITTLIVTGKLPGSMPQSVPENTRKVYTLQSVEYRSLVNAFQMGLKDLQETIQKFTACWTKDNTSSIVNELPGYLTKCRVCKLTAVYSKITLDEVADYLKEQLDQPKPSLEEVRNLLQEMLAEKLIYGFIISAKDSVPAHITFTSPASAKTTEELQSSLLTLQGEIKKLASIARSVHKVAVMQPALVFNNRLGTKADKHPVDSLETNISEISGNNLTQLETFSSVDMMQP